MTYHSSGRPLAATTLGAAADRNAVPALECGIVGIVVVPPDHTGAPARFESADESVRGRASHQPPLLADAAANLSIVPGPHRFPGRTSAPVARHECAGTQVEPADSAGRTSSGRSRIRRRCCASERPDGEGNNSAVADHRYFRTKSMPQLGQPLPPMAAQELFKGMR